MIRLNKMGKRSKIFILSKVMRRDGQISRQSVTVIVNQRLELLALPRYHCFQQRSTCPLPKRRYLEVALARTATSEHLAHQRNIPTTSQQRKVTIRQRRCSSKWKRNHEVPSHITIRFPSRFCSKVNDRQLHNGNGSNGVWTENTNNCFLK